MNEIFGENLKRKGEMERKWNLEENKKNMEKHREWNDGNWRGKNGIEEEKNETLEMKQKKSNWNLLVVQWQKRLDSEDQWFIASGNWWLWMQRRWWKQPGSEDLQFGAIGSAWLIVLFKLLWSQLVKTLELCRFCDESVAEIKENGNPNLLQFLRVYGTLMSGTFC